MKDQPSLTVSNDRIAGAATICYGPVAGVRWLLREDGTRVLQSPVAYSQGTRSWVEWVDVPEVTA